MSSCCSRRHSNTLQCNGAAYSSESEISFEAESWQEVTVIESVTVTYLVCSLWWNRQELSWRRVRGQGLCVGCIEKTQTRTNTKYNSFGQRDTDRLTLIIFLSRILCFQRCQHDQPCQAPSLGPRVSSLLRRAEEWCQELPGGRRQAWQEPSTAGHPDPRPSNTLYR